MTRGECENPWHLASAVAQETYSPHSMMWQRALELAGSETQQGPTTSKIVAVGRNCEGRDQNPPGTRGTTESFHGRAERCWIPEQQNENRGRVRHVVVIEILTLIHSGRLAPKPRH